MDNINPYMQQQVPYNPYMNPPVGQQMFMNPPTPIGMYTTGVGNYNYNNTVFNPYNQQQQGYIFAPAGQTQFGNPYEAYKQQQQSNYYAPYDGIYQQNTINPYSYNGYGGYVPFYSLQQQQLAMQNQIELQKMRHRSALRILGEEIDETYLDMIYNPNSERNKVDPEVAKRDSAWKSLQNTIYFINNPDKCYVQNPAQVQAYWISVAKNNYHTAFDNHSLCQFIEEDYPKLALDQWIGENIKKNASRDLSSVYNSRDYNELLKIHQSSNPYLNELMDVSRYDNNLDDMEIGLAEIFEREKQRRNVLNKPLPNYVSSPEVQAKRAEFTKALMDQLYDKEMRIRNV